jgi:spore germination cell wall hydrolase CwlJ-like protein
VLSVSRIKIALLASIAVAPTLAASAPAQPLQAQPKAISDQTSPALTPAVVETPITIEQTDASADTASAVVDDADKPLTSEESAAIDCIAKVVRHEAANQSAKGQLAVAQLIVNRVKVGSRFGHDACAVVNQPGQFFNTASYNPDRSSPAWTRAITVSRDALEELSPPVTPGALFYHAAYQAPPSFFRSRQRVAVLGDHVFYR